MSFTIDELAVPESLEGPGGDAFREHVRVRNAVEVDVLGTDLLTPSVEELWPEYRSNPTRERVHLTASVDGVAVGRAMVTTRPHSPGAGAYLAVDVLPEHRGRGIGAALLDRVESAAVAVGETSLKFSIPHAASTEGPRIASPTGFGELPERDPGVAFLLRHGYSLEQVVRISVLDTDGLAPRIDDLLRDVEKSAGDDYRLVAWVGPTPAEWLDDLATLRTRMSTDTPMAGLAAPPDPWDVARVADHDALVGERSETVLTTAARHVPSGRLVGFSEIVVPPARPAAVQEDTLVVREHRGRRLGMLMKVANARDLVAVSPRTEAIVTWNAEENRPMLDVNERMGFRPIGYEGGWLKQRRGTE